MFSYQNGQDASCSDMAKTDQFQKNSFSNEGTQASGTYDSLLVHSYGREGPTELIPETEARSSNTDTNRYV